MPEAFQNRLERILKDVLFFIHRQAYFITLTKQESLRWNQTDLIGPQKIFIFFSLLFSLAYRLLLAHPPFC